MPLLEHWNGRRFSLARARLPPRPRLRPVSYLADVSCASPRSCEAVGYSGNAAGTAGVPLAERWDGRRWALQPVPSPMRASAAFLTGVSCVAADRCTAVGFASGRAGAATLVERWNGSRWQLDRSVTPQGAVSVQLTGISCAGPRTCVASGFFTIVTGLQVLLAERWNGRRWSIERIRYPRGAFATRLDGASCADPSACVVVGSAVDARGVLVPLAERWNGRAWSIIPTSAPAMASASELLAVSCPSPRRCVATGQWTDRSGDQLPLAEAGGTDL